MTDAPINEIPTTQGSEQLQPPGLHRLAFGAYQHISAVFGALAIAAFFTHFFEFDWHGVFSTLFGVWNSTVRPVTKFVLDASVVPLFRIFGWHVTIPLVVRDYVAAGFVLIVSIWRAGFTPEAKASSRATLSKVQGMFWRLLREMWVPDEHRNEIKELSLESVDLLYDKKERPIANFARRFSLRLRWAVCDNALRIALTIFAVLVPFVVAIAMVLIWPIITAVLILRLTPLGPETHLRIFKLMTGLHANDGVVMPTDDQVRANARKPLGINQSRQALYPFVYLAIAMLANHLIR